MAGTFDDTIRYVTGEPIRGATVTVYLADTLNEALLFDHTDGTTPIANPLTTSSVGRLSFATGSGLYDLSVQTPYGVQVIEDINITDGALGANFGTFSTQRMFTFARAGFLTHDEGTDMRFVEIV